MKRKHDRRRSRIESVRTKSDDERAVRVDVTAGTVCAILVVVCRTEKRSVSRLSKAVRMYILATSVLDANSSGNARAGYDRSRDSRNDGSGDGEGLEHV